LKGRSALGFNFGLFSGVSSSSQSDVNFNIFGTGLTNSTMDAKTNGSIGGITFRNWVEEDLAVKLNVEYLSGQANVTVSPSDVIQRVSAVFPVLAGVDYYLLKPEPGSALRPFITGSLGLFLGTEANNSTLNISSHTETSFGVRLGAGIDFLLSNHFIFNVNAGYNVMTNFASQVGGRNNYNGADFSIGLDYLF
jgi:outer membrane protein W